MEEFLKRGIHVTNILNPFDPMHNREFKVMPEGLSLKQCIDLARDPLDGCYYVAAVNGELVPQGTDYAMIYPQGNVVLCAVPQGGGGGGGKNTLRIILQLVVVIVAAAATWYLGGAGGFLAGGSMNFFSLGMSVGVANAIALGVGTAISVVGNMLISALMPYDMADSTNGQSPSYGWDLGNNSNREGVVWPVLYGTARITPPIIGKYLEIVDNKQYLNVLYALADHALTSIDETSIRLNDNPLYQDADSNIDWEYRLGAIDQKLISYFNDTRSTKSVGIKLSAHTKYSEASTYSPDDEVNYNGYPWKCIQANGPGNIHYPAEGAYWTASTHPWVTVDTDGTQTEALGIALSAPKGLYIINEDGNYENEVIRLDIEYKEANSANWTPMKRYNINTKSVTQSRWSAGWWKQGIWYEIEAGSTTPSAHTENDSYSPTIWIQNPSRMVTVWHWLVATQTINYIDTVDTNYYHVEDCAQVPLRRIYYIDHLPPGEYQVRLRRYGGYNPDSTKVINDCYCDYIESIVYDDFTYPGSSIFALRALATDRISGGMPTLSLIATRATVPVWTSLAYENLPADNPAWASYDVLHNNNYGGGVPYSRIRYADFLAWANNNDLHYTAPNVASSVSFKCNYYIDESTSLRKILNNLGQLGRGNVVQMGSEFTCFVDKLETLPAQSFIFNMANIKSKSFNIEYMDMESRANAIDVTFWDKDNNYKQRTIELHADDFDSATTEIKKTQLTLRGCVTLAEALAHGYFALNCNRLLTCTGNLEADIDAIGCLPWDVVEVQHDVTLWGEGGLVVHGAINSIELDKEITLYPNKTYTLRVQSKTDDTIESYTLASVEAETTTNIVQTTENFDPVPVLQDKWIVTETDQATKYFRLIKTTRINDLTRKLVCFEYNSEIYDDTKTLSLEVLPTAPVQESNLRAEEIQRWNGSPDTEVHLSWTGFALSWNVFVKSYYDENYTLKGTTSIPFFRLTDLIAADETYTFCVSHTKNPADGITTTLTVAGNDAIAVPDTPLGLTASLVDNVIKLAWTSPADMTITGHSIYLNNSLLVANVAGNEYVYNAALTAGTYNFTLKAVNRGGESTATTAASITINVPTTPTPAATIIGEQAIITWGDCKSSLPIDYYKVNTVLQGKTLRYIDRIDWTGAKAFSVVAVDIAGNESAAGSVSVTTTALSTPTNIVPTGFTYAIRLALTYATFTGFDVVEIWASADNNRTNAVKVGECATTSWTHNGLDLVAKRYYWIRTRNIYGILGAFYPAAADGGVEGNTSSSATDYLTILNGYANLNTIGGCSFLVTGKINGNDAVGLTGDLIIDGSILARNIGANEVIANSANIKDAIISSAKIISLDVSKLTSGSITSKQIYLALSEGEGDVWIAGGKRDFLNSWVLGGATTQFDITNPSGTTFRYTWDGTGTDPLISASTMQIGTSVVIAAQNFDAGNNGTFVLTAVGTNYFEVTNETGVVETDKTIGTGSITASDAGFILGLDDSDSNKAKFFIGDRTSYLNWDGSKILIVGDLKSGTSGERFEFTIDNNAFNFYDASNNVNIFLGVSSYCQVCHLDTHSATPVGTSQANESDFAYQTIRVDNHAVLNHGPAGTYARIVGLAAICNATKSGSYTLSNIGLVAYAADGDTNYGISCYGATAPIILNPSDSSSAPSHAARKGSLWVTSAGVLYINTDGSTTWRKVGAQ